VLATRRYKTIVPVVIVLAVLIVGVLALRSRGDDKGPLETVDRTTNCPPVARPDVAATRPGETVLSDVLANDSDPESDPLVFQILSATGGDAALADGGTPTDSSDDRVSFTPDDPPVAEAVVKYQALDTQGSFSDSTLTIYVNADAAPPAGVASAPLETAASDGCGDAPDTTTSTIDEPVAPIGPSVPDTIEDQSTTSVSLKAGSHTTTTKKSGKGTTTTTKKPNNNTTTTHGTTPTTSAPATTSTTKKPTSSTTAAPSFPECQAYSPSSDAYRECVKARAQGKPYPPTTSTTAGG
jgi:hypothetical protein